MIVVPAGAFLMGSPAGEGNSDEHPQHRVTIAWRSRLASLRSRAVSSQPSFELGTITLSRARQYWTA
jgi:hypothetical protein